MSAETRPWSKPSSSPISRPDTTSRDVRDSKSTISPRSRRPRARGSCRAWAPRRGSNGNPVKQYEPYFSSTDAFEGEAELHERGVTVVPRYDPLERLARSDYPDGTHGGELP
jgi:hypothetical protein